MRKSTSRFLVKEFPCSYDKQKGRPKISKMADDERQNVNIHYSCYGSKLQVLFCDRTKDRLKEIHTMEQ